VTSEPQMSDILRWARVPIALPALLYCLQFLYCPIYVLHAPLHFVRRCLLYRPFCPAAGIALLCRYFKPPWSRLELGRCCLRTAHPLARQSSVRQNGWHMCLGHLVTPDPSAAGADSRVFHFLQAQQLRWCAVSVYFPVMNFNHSGPECALNFLKAC
jgi:hypothetical protein